MTSLDDFLEESARFLQAELVAEKEANEWVTVAVLRATVGRW